MQRRNMLAFIGLFLMIVLSNSNDWQAQGTFTSDNMTFISQTISTCISRHSNGNLDISEFAKTISNALNNAWDQAWNVFVTQLTNYNTDTVVFGYAFNNHWMWLNNYGSDHLSYVIWKDYNCGKYVTFSHSGYGTFDYTFSSQTFNAVTNHVSSIVDSKPSYYTNPWQFSFDLVTWMNSHYPGAYSAVVYTYNATNFYGRFCNYNNKSSNSYTFSFKSNGPNTLSYMLFETRGS